MIIACSVERTEQHRKQQQLSGVEVDNNVGSVGEDVNVSGDDDDHTEVEMTDNNNNTEEFLYMQSQDSINGDDYYNNEVSRDTFVLHYCDYHFCFKN